MSTSDLLVDGKLLLLIYFVGVNLWYLALLVSSMLELRRHILLISEESRHLLLSSTLSPTISILAPAFNEEASIEPSLRSLLALQYPNLEVIVVSDGSTDRTLQVLIDRFDLVPVKTIYEQRLKTRPVRSLYRSSIYPSLVVVDKENGGKADALNVGLSFARGELVCAMDADTLIEADGLQRMVRPFLLSTEVVAAGGTIRVVNGSEVKYGRVVETAVPTNPLAGIQVVEYLRAFLFGRLGWNRLGGNIIVSGAFGLFQREAVLNAGGYLHDTVGEDMELVLRLKRISYETGGPGKIAFVPDSVAWTEVPESTAVLGRQRDRWHRGLADVLWRHRRMLFNPGYGVTGLFIYPYYAFVELLAPVFEAVGLAALVIGVLSGVDDWAFAGLFFLSAYGLGTALTAVTLIVEDVSFHRYDTFRDRALLFVWALLENLGYRQLTVYWRLRGVWKFLRGRKDWGKMDRKGFRPPRVVACVGFVFAATYGAGLVSAQSRPPCAARSVAGEAIDRGWSAYRKGDVALAGSEFRRALSLCPNDPGALTGAGYAAMRLGRLSDARNFFRLAVGGDSTSYDAVAGSGMAAYRAGDLAAARRSFERALAIAPRDSTALSYLARIPEQVEYDAPKNQVRPLTTTVAARTGRRIFEIPGADGRWSPMWIKAVNLGTALPGKHPSEFPPNDSTYENWIALLGAMGANAVRVYTIHPPHFYAALRNWNIKHPSHPIWLIHGVWTELPPGKKREKYDDPKWLGQFRQEMQHVAALIHGNASIAPVPGHASGVYRADVSQWTLGYIIGREWEPYSVVAYNALRPTRTSFAGKYLTLAGGNALEVWLTEQCDYMVAFEMERYNAQRPIAYTNWPTLDPLAHPTETTMAQEIALLRARGEKIVEKSKEYDNDAVGLDAVKMHATAAYPAGVFASYHAYPYYPDFIRVDPNYSSARSSEGPSNYLGYLRELVTHHGDMPVVISEFGVPSSRGIGHFQPQGWTHGGLSEDQQAAADARLTRDIYASGAAGAGLFSLIDEWFKKNWIVTDFEIPAERKRLWLNPLDAEESYGVIAMRAGRKDSQILIDGDTSDWRGRPILYASHPTSLPAPLQLKSLRVAQDEAYVYLRLDVGRIDWAHAHYQIGIDTYGRGLGDTRLPHTGSRSPTGLEFVLDIGGPGATQVLVDHPYNPYRPVAIPGSSPPAIQYVYAHPLRTVANDAAQWDSLVVVPNRRRIGRNGQIYPAISYNRNRLLYSAQSRNSLADWFADPASGVIEVRLPWGMLQVIDPSTRSVLFGNTALGEGIGAASDGFRFVVESYDPAKPNGGADHLPRGALTGFADPPTWTWPTWETPQWHAEIKPVFSAMQRTFAGIPDRPSVH